MASTKIHIPEEELRGFLPAWTVREGRLVRDWSFPDFVAAMEFVNHVATLAEAANHHPDIDIRYNRVTLALISHDAGGITARDARMAHQLNARFPPPAATAAA